MSLINYCFAYCKYCNLSVSRILNVRRIAMVKSDRHLTWHESETSGEGGWLCLSLVSACANGSEVMTVFGKFGIFVKFLFT